jgi:hypothetical protein
VHFDVLPSRLGVGQEAELRFALEDAGGLPLHELVSHHGRKLHVVIVSEDMQVFGHVHPQDFGSNIVAGEGSVEFAFPRPGRYLASADAMTASGSIAEHFTLTVGDGAPAPAGETSAARMVVVEVAEGDIYTAPVLFDQPSPTGGYEVSVSRPAAIQAGEEVAMTWRFAKDGAPITDLRLFLEAAMHLAVVKADFGQFVHGHGVPRGVDTGFDHVHGSGGTETEAEEPEISYFGPEVVAMVTFPEPGRYYLFGQAAHGDQLLISRISVDIDA